MSVVNFDYSIEDSAKMLRFMGLEEIKISSEVANNSGCSELIRSDIAIGAEIFFSIERGKPHLFSQRKTPATRTLTYINIDNFWRERISITVSCVFVWKLNEAGRNSEVPDLNKLLLKAANLKLFN